ncbi:hypothetical protein T12_7859 [Trichinella patagoniensis]|uniref:Uncharacterized protein n=1 Tax=Trichinella patagoniensis TaxID=990121 RepID=A0A0V0YV32_9BILA|nr:hypothetical protein T12_7859 [Trichinella patagoniensis]
MAWMPSAHLPGRFERDLFDRSQLELLNLSTLDPHNLRYPMPK